MDGFEAWWKEVGQYECAMTVDGFDEFKRVIRVAFEAGQRAQKAIEREASKLEREGV